jgi:hypothetical protein
MDLVQLAERAAHDIEPMVALAAQSAGTSLAKSAGSSVAQAVWTKVRDRLHLGGAADADQQVAPQDLRATLLDLFRGDPRFAQEVATLYSTNVTITQSGDRNVAIAGDVSDSTIDNRRS